MAVSPILQIPEVAPTQQDKTTTINDAIVALENATQNQLTVSFAAGDVTLTTTQFVGYVSFLVSGLTAAHNLIVPLQMRNFFVDNTAGTHTVTVKGATGASVAVAAGQMTQIQCNGTNCVTTTVSSALGTVTQVIAGAGLAGGTISTTGTLSLGTIAAGGFLVNPGTAAAVPTAGSFGTGLTLTSGGVLQAATGSGTVTQIVAGAGLAGGTITAAGTVSLGTIAAQSFLVNAGTVGAVPSAGTFGANLTLNAGGTLSAAGGGSGNWSGPTISAVSTLFSSTGGTLDLATPMRSIPIAFSFSGKPAAGQMIHVALINDVPININSGLAGTATYVGADPAATADFILSKVNAGTVTAIGTIAISTAGSITLTGSAYTSANGDALRMAAPGTQDATLADVCITVEAKRP